MKKIALIIVIILTFSSLQAQNTVGTLYLSPGVQEAYTLFNPGGSTTSFLIDNCGREVHSWQSDYIPAKSVYLLENGNLLRTCITTNDDFYIAGVGGRLEILDWESNIIWEYSFSDTSKVQHHDIEPLPNGNILLLAVEKKSFTECNQAGMDTTKLAGVELFPEFVAEIKPVGQDSGAVVWEWHMWDHLIQEFNPGADNYGVVKDYPELFNANYFVREGSADWAHGNSVAYNSNLDQVVISLNKFNEFIIIDHSTTPEESGSHSGGDMGKGGDILYRWGNPETYQHGDETDQQNFGQHTVYWIPEDYPDAGKIMLFNNGKKRDYSSVDIVQPLTDPLGNYILRSDTTFGPDTAEWTYMADDPYTFFSNNISGAQRLTNGNTLICEGNKGRFFEIDDEKNIVWEYQSPVGKARILAQGDPLISGISAFRATKYKPDHPAFAGKDMTPGDPIELNPDLSICITSGIGKGLYENSLDVYPNPFIDNITMTIPAGIHDETIRVFNLMGELVHSEPLTSSEINLGFLEQGIYMIRIGYYSQKIIKL